MIFPEQRLLLCDVLNEEKIVCVDDDLFQSSHPGDFDVPTTVGGSRTIIFYSSLTN